MAAGLADTIKRGLEPRLARLEGLMRQEPVNFSQCNDQVGELKARRGLVGILGRALISFPRRILQRTLAHVQGLVTGDNIEDPDLLRVSRTLGEEPVRPPDRRLPLRLCARARGAASCAAEGHGRV